MSQRSFFSLFILLAAITQALPSIASALTLETRASKTCPRGQRAQLSITAGEHPTRYGRTLESDGAVVGAYIDFDTTDITQASNFTFVNTNGDCFLAIYGDNKSRSITYQLSNDTCDEYADVDVGPQPNIDPSGLQSAPVFCNIDAKSRLACSVTYPSCEPQNILYTITARYRGLSLGRADNDGDFPPAKVHVTILPIS